MTAFIYAIEARLAVARCLQEFPRTGELLPAAADLGWVRALRTDALSQARTFGKDYRNNLSSAQFNRGRIQRHVRRARRGGFKIKSEDFLVSSDKDFHPTECSKTPTAACCIDRAAGSALAARRRRSPGRRSRAPSTAFRKKDAPALTTRADLEIRWDKFWAHPSDISPYRLLRDARFAVRDRAIAETSERGKSRSRDPTIDAFLGHCCAEDQKQPEKHLASGILWALHAHGSPRGPCRRAPWLARVQRSERPSRRTSLRWPAT